MPGNLKARVQVGDNVWDSGRMCVLGEVRVKEGGWMGEGVTTHNDHHALSWNESAWWS